MSTSVSNSLPISSDAPEAGRTREPAWRLRVRDVRHKSGFVLVLLGIGAAALPIVLSVGNAIQQGWVPVGDNAWAALQVKDVWSTAPPTLGAGSAVTSAYGTETNAPGPLLFYLLAPFYRLSGFRPWGLLVGAACLTIASVVGMAYAARRRGGTLFVLWSMCFLFVMVFALRGQMLHDIWNATIPILPLALLLFVSWSASCGGARALPLVVLSASFIAQAHASYLGLGVALGFWALVGLALSLWQDRARLSDDAWARRRTHALRWILVSAGVATVCWILPLYDQFFGYHNMSHLAEANANFDKVGIEAGYSRLTYSLGLPPFFTRQIDDQWTVLLTAGSAEEKMRNSIFASFAVCGFVAAWRRRRADTRMIATAAVAFAAGVWTAAQAPVGSFLSYAYRWEWPVGMFIWLTFSWTAYQVLRPHLPVLHEKILAGALAALLVYFLFVGTQQPPFEDTDYPAFSKVTDLTDQVLKKLPSNGPYLVYVTQWKYFDVGWGLMAELEARGVDTQALDERQPPYWGSRRRFDGNVKGMLTVFGGPDILNHTNPSEVVAFVPGGNFHRDPDTQLDGYGLVVLLGPAFGQTQ